MDTGKNNVSEKMATILVVEDSSMNQMLIDIMLRRLNHNVIIVSNGKEAIAVLQETSVDLVLSDIMMPEMDGFELLEKIRSSEDSNHMPVVLMTAGGVISLSNKAAKEGADGFLSHPFSSIELQQMISRFVSSPVS